MRRHPVLLVSGLLAFLFLVLALLALPLRTVPGDANTAKSELTQAVEALKAGDSEIARTHVDTARTHVDEVTGATESFGAKVWSLVPVAGSAVRDVRHLGAAMDELTAAAEKAMVVLPQVSGDEAKLLSDSTVDIALLESLIGALGTVEEHLLSAQSSLNEVKGTAPFVGATVADAKAEAKNQVDPVVDGLAEFTPFIESTPALLGKDGEKKYVVAMMNPAEMKYSGGSMLTFSVMSVKDGKIKRGKTIDGETSTKLFRPGFWENVEGNPFASAFSERITHANAAPSWPVAGEETLRAWEWLRKTEVDGLLALDVVAIARMMAATGPLQVEGTGEVNAENLVQMTTGEYQNFTLEQQSQRKDLNRRLVPAFMDALFEGADFIGTLQAVVDAGNSRHMAMYFRDEKAQHAVTEFGLAGDLSQTDHDYIGFFSQNMIGSKADFGQRKSITSKVMVKKDGSARVELTAELSNTNAPATGRVIDYTDPQINARLGLFLPREVTVKKVTVIDPSGTRKGSRKTGDYFGRPYLQEESTIDPGEKATLKVVYLVENAATLTQNGATYHLDLDPHPTVNDATSQVTVLWPQGWKAEAPTDVPGWSTTEKGNWRWTSEAMAARTSLELTAAQR